MGDERVPGALRKQPIGVESASGAVGLWRLGRRWPAIRCLLSVLLLAAWPSMAGAGQMVTYRILKDGEPIGGETVALSQTGDETVAEVTTETRVKVLFLDFHYNHRRVERWRAGRLESLVADTDDDGSIHHIDFRRTGDGAALVVDGTAEAVPPDILPLSLWGKAILDRKLLFGISDAALYHVTVTALGPATLVRDGRTEPAQHYRLSGEIERELWFGEDGLLLKTTFERRGYPIEVIRN